MVRFSQSLDKGQSQNYRKPNEKNRGEYYYEERQPHVVNMQPNDRLYSQPPQRQRYPNERPVYQSREDIYSNPSYQIKEESFDVEYKRPAVQTERESIQPDYSKPELKFDPEDNIKFGVEYSPNSKPPVIGKNHTIRSNSIIYNDVVIGDNFRTGHNVVIRENTNIGDDVLIGTNTVIEGDVIIGNDVSIQSNVYIPTNSVIEDNVFIGPCACFTNDKYPVRINYELQGPKVRRGASIGGNTTFLSNVEIGEGSIVAAGAIVIHSVPPFYLAIGTPARIKPLPDHLKVPNRF